MQGKEDIIKDISEKNLLEANNYFNQEIKSYLDNGFIEIPNLKKKIGDKILEMRNKFSNTNNNYQNKL